MTDDFATHAREVLADDPELVDRLLSLRGEVQQFAAQRWPGSTAPPAVTLNARNQHLLNQAAILLGPDKFERVFGFPSDEPMNLVDPEVARDTAKRRAPG